MFGEFKDEETLKSEKTSIYREPTLEKAERARAIRSLEKYLTYNAVSLSADGNHFIENIPFHFNGFMGKQ